MNAPLVTASFSAHHLLCCPRSPFSDANFLSDRICAAATFPAGDPMWFQVRCLPHFYQFLFVRHLWTILQSLCPNARRKQLQEIRKTMWDKGTNVKVSFKIYVDILSYSPIFYLTLIILSSLTTQYDSSEGFPPSSMMVTAIRPK